MTNEMKFNDIGYENPFQTLGFFMLRSTLISVEKYKDIFCNNNTTQENIDLIFKTVKNSKEIPEAILVSSLSLYNELKNLDETKNERKKNQIISSLVKYLTRMSTRTTPFGLFSGVARGSFGDKTTITLQSHKKNTKRARVDMEWLYGVIRKIENDEEILSEIHVTRNNLIFPNGTRLDIGYISNYGQLLKDDNLDNITASIIYSEQVRTVLEFTQKPIKFKELIRVLKSKYQQADLNTISNFLKQLLLNEYLITEMRPTLINCNTLDYVIERLNSIEKGNELNASLREVQGLIEEYNNLFIGEGIDLYLYIIDKMQEIHECNNYIQIDMSLGVKDVQLSSQVAQEALDIVKLALKLSAENSYLNHLEDYLNDFLEVYGDDREIALLELLDEDRGLGAPAGYTKPTSQKTRNYKADSKEFKAIQSYLHNKISHSLLNNQQEVILTDSEIEDIKVEYDENEIPDSLEIYLLLSKDPASDDIKLHMGPNPGAQIAGKSFGRFIDIMPEEIKKDLVDLENKQQQLNDNTIIAEIIELPQSGRSSNVSINWTPREHQLVIATNANNDKNMLDIKDLYVGIETQKGKRVFYIKSKSLGKKVSLRANNMLNYTLCSNIYRFLIEISLMGKKSILNNLNGLFAVTFSNMKYIPRIVYKNTVLYPATWRLNTKDLNITEKEISKEEFYEIIKNWRLQWKVPGFVYLTESDNRLLLNLENSLHLDELYNIFNKNKGASIILTEIEGGLDNRVAKGEEGFYCTEIVVPLVKNTKSLIGVQPLYETLETKSDYLTKRSELSTYDKNRVFLPGDEWLSMKLYGNSKRIDEAIAYNILPFCEELVRNKLIEKFFFLRYGDPQNHIRLRLKAEKDNLYHHIMPKLNSWFIGLCSDGLLSNVVIDTYKREVERYGGIELIELAEDVFYADSILVANLINLNRSRQLNLQLELIVAACIINMLEEFGLDYHVQKQIFTRLYDKSSNRGLFEKNRKTLLNLCNSNNSWQGLREINGGLSIYNLLQFRKNAINRFADKMYQLDEEGELWNDKISILLSIIHMHCNRIFGSRAKEEIIMATVRHTLYSLEYVKKAKEEKDYGTADVLL